MIITSRQGTLYVLRIGISTNGEGFIHLGSNAVCDAISPRTPADPRAELAHRVVEIPRSVPDPRARRVGFEAELSSVRRTKRRRYSGPNYPLRRSEGDGAPGTRGRGRGAPRELVARYHRGWDGRRLRRNRIREHPDAPRWPRDLRRGLGRLDPRRPAAAVERLLRARHG